MLVKSVETSLLTSRFWNIKVALSKIPNSDSLGVNSILRMMNQSWTRVPSVLSTVASTMSTQSDKESILKFKETLETQNKLGSLRSTFDAMISSVDKNIKLRMTDLFHWSRFRQYIIYGISYTVYLGTGQVGWRKFKMVGVSDSERHEIFL